MGARGARSESPSADQGSAPSVAAASTDGTYTVKRGDTLSKIARERKPESVSLEQMLVAMYRSNENAFDGKNMNRLRSGQILTVPAAEKVAAVAAADAAEFVKVQTVAE